MARRDAIKTLFNFNLSLVTKNSPLWRFRQRQTSFVEWKNVIIQASLLLFIFSFFFAFVLFWYLLRFTNVLYTYNILYNFSFYTRYLILFDRVVSNHKMYALPIHETGVTLVKADATPFNLFDVVKAFWAWCIYHVSFFYKKKLYFYFIEIYLHKRSSS